VEEEARRLYYSKCNPLVITASRSNSKKRRTQLLLNTEASARGTTKEEVFGRGGRLRTRLLSMKLGGAKDHQNRVLDKRQTRAFSLFSIRAIRRVTRRRRKE